MIQKAGSGRTGTVWKARHLGLNEYRAVKCVPKYKVDHAAFCAEAMVLKNLDHPGIPLVYDLEEDADYFYLIEEYLEGCSLYALIKDQGTLQEDLAVRYGLQICSLVEYLHHSCNQPILHLDLQPNNLIIWNDTVRLIDFDHAADRISANAARVRYGTEGCAAPEQYTSDHPLDERTDIYAIGAVLRFMVKGTLKPDAENGLMLREPLEAVIRKCMEPDMELRYQTAAETGKALGQLLAAEQAKGCLKRDQRKAEEKSISSHRIILTGNRPGAGVTHLALGLCIYLKSHGVRVLYEERNRTGAVRNLAKALGGVRSGRDGILNMKGLDIMPLYGPAACFEEPKRDFDIILKDFGTDWRSAGEDLKREGGVCLGIVCQSLWERGLTDRMVEELIGLEPVLQKPYPLILIKRGTKRRGEKPGSLYRRAAVFASPYYEDPFHPDLVAAGFFKAVWKEISLFLPAGKMEGGRRKCWGKSRRQ